MPWQVSMPNDELMAEAGSMLDTEQGRLWLEKARQKLALGEKRDAIGLLRRSAEAKQAIEA